MSFHINERRKHMEKVSFLMYLDYEKQFNRLIQKCNQYFLDNKKNEIEANFGLGFLPVRHGGGGGSSGFG